MGEVDGDTDGSAVSSGSDDGKEVGGRVAVGEGEGVYT